MKLSQCHESFIRQIIDLADRCGKTPDTVYALWRKYSDACQASDQSAILFEFCQWYAKELIPAVPYRIVTMGDNGSMNVTDFEPDAFLDGMEKLGFKPSGWHNNERTRKELHGAPIFCSFCGPAWDGDKIRYEDSRSNDRCSA